MLKELKNLPHEQKKWLARTVTLSSMTFLVIAGALWLFRDEAILFLGISSGTIDLIAGILCVMVMADLLIVKYIIGEEKAR